MKSTVLDSLVLVLVVGLTVGGFIYLDREVGGYIKSYVEREEWTKELKRRESLNWRCRCGGVNPGTFLCWRCGAPVPSRN